MAKDPAFLFFPGDWLGGTMTFTRSHKGAYMDLLMCQFNQGHMALQDIQVILGEKDYTEMWDSKLKAKFKVDENGLFYNEKLESEIIKRRSYTESRKKNLSKPADSSTHKKDHKGAHKAYHMAQHMEDENENEDIDVLEERRKDFTKNENSLPFPGFPMPNHLNGLPEIKVGAVIELIQITKQKKVTKVDVIGMWEVFKVQNLTGKKFYQDEGAVHSHFINWIKKQDFHKTGWVKGNNDPIEDEARKILKAVNKK
jgi:uncharacterized protein YdaU (DUF1376 family)